MGERGQRAVLGVLVVVAVAPVFSFVLCPHRADCLRAIGQVSVWLDGGAKVGLVMAAVSLLAWAARVVWLLHLDARLVRTLPESRRTQPAELLAAMRSTGLRRTYCVVSDLPIAFCAGVVRPVVVVSDGLVRCLRPSELQAVLVHELAHARRREPLLRAATRAAADVLFYAPVVRWWSRRLAARSELRADRAAIETVGRGPVAGALVALGSNAWLDGATAFAGIAQLRVAQVLGDPLPAETPNPSVLGTTVIGAYLAFVVTCCLIEVFLRVAR